MDYSKLLREITSSPERLTPERYQEIITLTTQEITQRYAHLTPRFHPNNNMQAKIHLRNRTTSMLERPEPFIQVLLNHRFLPDALSHRDVTENRPLSNHQYILLNSDLKMIGYEFMLQATLGPSFIFIVFRNLSAHWRLDIPLYYALEILNRIDDRLNQIDLRHYGPNRGSGDTIATHNDQ